MKLRPGLIHIRFSPKLLVTGALIFGAAGAALLLMSFASSSGSISFEAESATFSGAAVVCAGDAGVSQLHFLRFNGSCPGNTAGAQVRVLGPVHKVRPDDNPSGAQMASLVSARNEFESFQVVVRAASGELSNLSAALTSPLTLDGGTATIPADNVTIYREGYYNVKTPSDREGAVGDWPDPLIPTVDRVVGEHRNAFPVTVPAGQNRVIWTDIHVPPDTPPGLYSGMLTITASGLNSVVPVKLTVLNFTMPSTTSMDSAFGTMSWGFCEVVFGDCYRDIDKSWNSLGDYIRVALDNRVSISYPYFEWPTVDYVQEPFNRHILQYINGTGPTRLKGARLTNLELDRRAGQQFDTFAKQGGWSDRSFVYACDEPHQSPEAWATCMDEARRTRTFTTAPNVITANIAEANAHGDTSLIDIIAPVVQHMHPRGSGSQRPAYDNFLAQSGKKLWLYISCESWGCYYPNHTTDPEWEGWPSYAIDQPASEARATGWMVFNYNAHGEIHWGHNWQLNTAWTDQYSFGGNGDATLFYPGLPSIIGGQNPVPVESMRLKLIRDGREDYEYLKFLADRGKGAEARAIATGLFPAAYDTNRSDAQVQQARLALARLVADVAGGPRP